MHLCFIAYKLSVLVNHMEGVIDLNQLVSAREARKIMGVSTMAEHNWVKAGILDRVKIGASVFYRKADVERLAKERAANGRFRIKGRRK